MNKSFIKKRKKFTISYCVLKTNYHFFIVRSMEQQYCKRCNATKNADEFNGINKHCIRCLEKEKGKYHRNKEKKAERWQKYYVEHKDAIKERHREYQKEYRQTEVWCDTCKCKVKKCRASKHLQTQAHQQGKAKERRRKAQQDDRRRERRIP